MAVPHIRRQHIRSSLAALMYAGKTPQSAGRIAGIRTIFRNFLFKPWPQRMDPKVSEELNYQLSQADTLCRREGIPTRLGS